MGNKKNKQSYIKLKPRAFRKALLEKCAVMRSRKLFSSSSQSSIRRRAALSRGEGGASTSNTVSNEIPQKTAVENENVGDAGNKGQLATVNANQQEDAEFKELEIEVKKEVENLPELPSDDEEYHIIFSEPNVPVHAAQIMIDVPVPTQAPEDVLNDSMSTSNENLIIDEKVSSEESSEDEPNIDYKKEYKKLIVKTAEQTTKIQKQMSKIKKLNAENRSLKKVLEATQKELESLKQRYKYEKAKTEKYNMRKSDDITFYNT